MFQNLRLLVCRLLYLLLLAALSSCINLRLTLLELVSLNFFLLRFSFFHLILKFLVELAQLCFNLHLVFQLLLLLHLLVILFPKPCFVHLALEFHFIQIFSILTLVKFRLCDFFEMV